MNEVANVKYETNCFLCKYNELQISFHLNIMSCVITKKF